MIIEYYPINYYFNIFFFLKKKKKKKIKSLQFIKKKNINKLIQFNILNKNTI